MIIDSKFAYVKKKEVFEPLINTIPSGLNPIVFIEDTREMWTCGTYFSIGYPSIEISEVSGSVKVQIGNSFFLMSTAGESISIRKGDGNRIIISSNALSRVDTEPPLEWDAANRKLLHKTSGVVPGSYGQSTNLGNASIFVIPNIIVDATGHVTLAENHNIEIRDYVEQLAPSTLMGDRNILLSYNEASNTADTSQVRKANGLTFNDATQKMTIAGGMNSNGPVNVNHGDLSVLDGYIIGNLKGDVQGEATPKIHISLNPEYGGASTKLYGHVKLQDILNTKPDPSSDNENINDTNVVAAIAASPLMVWNAIQTAKDYADSILGSNNAMLYKGAVEAGTTSPGSFTPTADVGNTYVVTFGTGTYTDSVGYINGEPVEIGDLLICKESTPAATSSTWSQVRTKWTFVQTNTTGVVSGPSSSVVGQLAVFNSTTGKLIKGLRNGNIGQMLVIGNSGIPEWVNRPDRLNHALSFQVRGDEFISFDGYEPKRLNFIAGDNVFITPDAQGNLTFAADPGSDTVNTAGATNKIGTKLFLIGAESQTTSPQTYSNQYVYIGPDNKLYSNGKVVSTGDHVHNYAGATSSGGPALKVDLNPSGLLDATYGSYGGILQDSNKGPVSGSWSNRIKILHNNSTGYYTELAQNFTGTAGLWHRRNEAGTLSEWIPVIDKANFHTYLDDTYVIRGNDPNVLTNYVRYSIASGLTMNFELGNETPTHIWGIKGDDSSNAYVFNGDNIRIFANAVNRAGDTMTGTLKVTEIQTTGDSTLIAYSDNTTYLGQGAGTTYIKSGETDLQHRYNGTDYKIWDTRNLVGLITEHHHNTINYIDSRDTVSTPQEHPAGVWLDFKANGNAGLSDGGTYTGLLTVKKYGSATDWSGGKSAQFGFTDNSNVWVRFGTGTTWEAWKQLATAEWADGKFLPLAGGTMVNGARISHGGNLYIGNSNNSGWIALQDICSQDSIGDGIWSIRTNGTAVFTNVKKVGSSDSYVLLGGGGHKALDLLIQVDRGGSISNRDNQGANQVWFDYNFGGSGIVGSAISFTGLTNYATQICAGYSDSNSIGVRTFNGDRGTWNSVKKLWHNGNFDPNSKVSKSGDTMTGRLSWVMNGVTSSIDNGNSSYTHYNTNASAGHWFNKTVYVAGNIYGGASYNRLLPFKDEINSQVGGSKSAQMNWASWGTGTYDGAIQIRETSLVGNGQSAWGYSPALTFHWGNRYAKRFGMRSDGQFAVDDVPISLSTHNHNSLYVTALGTNGNYLTWTKNGTTNNITVPYASNSDKLDGVHNGDVTANYYKVNGQQTLNLSALDSNKWYPCVMTAHPSNTTPIRVTFTDALSGHKPSWSTHSSGFSFQFDFEWIGGGWGTISWYLRVYRYAASFGGETACYGLEQRNNRSALVLYMRGGTSYYYRSTDGRSFTVYTSTTNIGDSTYPDNVSPRTSKLNDCYLQEAGSRYGTCYRATNADNVSNADTVDGYHANGLFTSLANSSNTISISIGGTTKTLTVGYASSAGSAATATYLPYQDTRSTNYSPYQSGFNTKGWSATHLKANTTDGLSDGGDYHASVYIYPWGDSSGGHAHNIAFTDNGNLWMRHGTSSWSSWSKVWTSGNLNPVDKTLLHKTRVPGEVVDFYVYQVNGYTCTSTDYTTFRNQLFDSSGRGKSSVSYKATSSSMTYTVNLSDFVLAYNGISAYSNGMYTAGGGELESNRIGSTAGANSKTITGYEMPKHAHWFGHYRSDNANDRDVFGPDGGQNHSTNGTTSAGQGGNWRTGYSGNGQSKDWRPKTIFVFKMVYAPQSW